MGAIKKWALGGLIGCIIGCFVFGFVLITGEMPAATILASSTRSLAILWDAATYTDLLTLRHPWDGPHDKRSVSSLAWSPDSRLLATAQDRIRIWETDTGKIRAQLFRWHGEEGMLIQHDGHYRATPGITRRLVYVVQTDTAQHMNCRSSLKIDWMDIHIML